MQHRVQETERRQRQHVYYINWIKNWLQIYVDINRYVVYDQILSISFDSRFQTSYKYVMGFNKWFLMTCLCIPRKQNVYLVIVPSSIVYLVTVPSSIVYLVTVPSSIIYLVTVPSSFVYLVTVPSSTLIYFLNLNN